jgi:predicted nucleotidyltransferase
MKTLLSKFGDERQKLLERIAPVLEKDARVVAAWLFGSIGRGEADELSDLDIWIVVADHAIEDIKKQRNKLVSQIGTPQLVVEAPQNAPFNGAYLMVFYESEVAPIQVDWYWQCQSDAFIPPDTKLLFDHLGLESDDQPIEFTNIDPDPAVTEDPCHFVRYFWAMLLITAKYAMRDPWAEEMELLPYVLGAFHQTQWYLNNTITDDRPAVVDHKHPKRKLQIFRKLSAEMVIMMTDLVAQGYDMPLEFVPGMNKYLEMFEFKLDEI